MCGRYSLTSPPELLVALFGLDVSPLDFAPRYNIAPTQAAPVVRGTADGGRELVALTWGLVPSWALDAGGGARLINARSETVGSKRSFRDAWRERRCLVPSNGFYEWKAVGRVKHPYYVHRADERPFAYAGLWERWRPPSTPEIPELEGMIVETFTIMTTEPNDLLRPLHDRMPVIVPPEAFDDWLDPEADPATLQRWLVPAPEEDLVLRPVGRRVNRPENDDPACVEPVPDPERANGWPEGSLFEGLGS